MGEDVKENLRKLFESNQDYTEVETNVEGLSVAVLPKKGKREKTMTLVLKPAGTWKGIYLRSPQQLAALKSLVNNPKTQELITLIEKVSPSATSGERKIQI